MSEYLPSLDFSIRFIDDLLNNRFSAAERSAVKKALDLLDTNDRHPSLQIHKLQGDEEGSWTCYVTRDIRITFERLDGGDKRLLTLTRHYDA
jgi:mRNA-degrading endonuclease YafQ of YafQ-DinJ toxin-antitoxin module